MAQSFLSSAHPVKHKEVNYFRVKIHPHLCFVLLNLGQWHSQIVPAAAHSYPMSLCKMCQAVECLSLQNLPKLLLCHFWKPCSLPDNLLSLLSSRVAEAAAHGNDGLSLQMWIEQTQVLPSFLYDLGLVTLPHWTLIPSSIQWQ